MKEIPCLEINDIKDTNLYSRINREVHSYKKVMLIQGASIFFIPIIFSLAIIMILSGGTEFDISDLIMNAIFGGATFLFIFLLFTFAFGLIFKYSLTSLFQKYPNLTKTIYIGDNVEETTQIIKKTKNERIIKIFGFLWDMAGMKNILSWNLVNQLPYANGAVMFQTPNQLFIPTAYVLNSNLTHII